MNKLPFITIGNLPSSYLASLTFEEQILWICKHIEELEKFVTDILEQKLNDYIISQFNNILFDTMYDENTETLILKLNESEVQ